MRILSLLVLSCCAVALATAAEPAPPTPHADPPPAGTTATTPSYRDVQPVAEAAIRALDAKDADALFRLISPHDLSELDEQGLQEAKKGIDGDRLTSLRGVLVKLATIPPVYHADIDALEFAMSGMGGGFFFQRIAGTWYITNHEPRPKP